MDVGEAAPEGQRRRKTALRTLRLPEDTLKLLETEAEEDGVSLNTLVSGVLLDYVLWSRRAKKFGFVTISKQLMRALLNSTDPEKLEKSVRETYPSILKSMAMFWYNDASPTSIIKVLGLISTRNWFVEMTQKEEGKDYTMTFHHDLGPNFSLFMKSMLDSTIRNEFRSRPIFQEGESSITVQFTLS